MKKKINVGDTQKNVSHITSAQEGNLKVLLKSDQGHTIIKMKEVATVYIDTSQYEIRKQKEFQYGILACTSPFQALYIIQ